MTAPIELLRNIGERGPELAFILALIRPEAGKPLQDPDSLNLARADFCEGFVPSRSALETLLSGGLRRHQDDWLPSFRDVIPAGEMR